MIFSCLVQVTFRFVMVLEPRGERIRPNFQNVNVDLANFVGPSVNK